MAGVAIGYRAIHAAEKCSRAEDERMEDFARGDSDTRDFDNRGDRGCSGSQHVRPGSRSDNAACSPAFSVGVVLHDDMVARFQARGDLWEPIPRAANLDEACRRVNEELSRRSR